MKDETKPDIKDCQDKTDAEGDLSRRDFLTTSTSTIAAASAIAAGASLVSGEAGAAWPKSSDAHATHAPGSPQAQETVVPDRGFRAVDH